MGTSSCMQIYRDSVQHYFHGQAELLWLTQAKALGLAEDFDPIQDETNSQVAQAKLTQVENPHSAQLEQVALERFANQATQILDTVAVVITTDHHPMIPILFHFATLCDPLDLSSLFDPLAFSSLVRFILASVRDGESY